MKKMLIIFLVLTLCGMLVSCSSTQTADTGSHDEKKESSASAGAAGKPDEAEESEADTKDLKGVKDETATTKDETAATKDETAATKDETVTARENTDVSKEYADAARSVYFAALHTMIKDHIFPDGTALEYEVPDDMDNSRFAIKDVDNDGKEELLLVYNSTFMSGMRGAVFAYDSETGSMVTELNEFPAMTFFDNGMVKARWSHNQGLAGDFWPYSLYRYNPETDSYDFVGMVDAWDKNFAETDLENKPFPDEIDVSGTGIVYYIMSAEGYDGANPADASVYKEWFDQYIGTAAELQIDYLNLTEDNLAEQEKES